jgi:hypothetical protein
MKVTIWKDGEIIEQYEVADPEPTSAELARKSALEKLTALGLTEEEVNALLGR